jgi:imidazolonepropionase
VTCATDRPARQLGRATGAARRRARRRGRRVAWTGPVADAPAADERLDVEGRCVLPGFVDAHTHLVFAGDRADEFAARLAGEPYAAGGIRTTVAATRAASDAELLHRARALAAEALRSGRPRWR